MDYEFEVWTWNLASALGIRILDWETGLLEFDLWARKMLEGEEERKKMLRSMEEKC